MNREERETFGKRGANMMKTDVKHALMSDGSSRLPPKNMGIITNTFFSHWCGRISFNRLLFITSRF